MQPLDTIVQKLYKENKSAAQIRLGFPYSKKPTAYLQGIVAEKIGLKTKVKNKLIFDDRSNVESDTKFKLKESYFLKPKKIFSLKIAKETKI